MYQVHIQSTLPLCSKLVRVVEILITSLAIALAIALAHLSLLIFARVCHTSRARSLSPLEGFSVSTLQLFPFAPVDRYLEIFTLARLYVNHTLSEQVTPVKTNPSGSVPLQPESMFLPFLVAELDAFNVSAAWIDLERQYSLPSISAETLSISC